LSSHAIVRAEEPSFYIPSCAMQAETAVTLVYLRSRGHSWEEIRTNMQAWFTRSGLSEQQSLALVVVFKSYWQGLVVVDPVEDMLKLRADCEQGAS
jgi:hypothetical protein